MTDSGKKDVGERLSSLTPAQRALLERRLLDQRSRSAEAHLVPRRSAASPVRVSHSQELLWLLDRIVEVGTAYNSPGAFRVRGRVDADALREALARLMQRHEILRTTYEVIDGVPMQIVHDSLPVDLKAIDLSELPEARREEELQHVLTAEAQHEFDLAVGPVMYTVLIRLADDDHVFLSVEHHIAVDGWSKGPLARDLSALYDEVVSEVPTSLPELPIQYADYAVWHRQWLDSGILERQLSYWKGRLRAAPARLDLPTDRPRPAVSTYRGANRTVLIEPDLVEALAQLARKDGATLFMALLAAYTMLLHRYSGQDDIVIGTPFAGRSRAELENVVGYFTNTLALRMDVSGEPSFRELLRRARETSIEAFGHGDVPYEMVIRAANPERDLSQMPLFQVMMVLHNPEWKTDRPKFQPAGTTATQLSHEKGWSKFDLTLGMSERSNGLNTTWEYSTELFERETVERMIGHFRRLIEGAVADPDRAVSTLPLLTEGERQLVLGGWAGAEAVEPSADTLHEIVEAQVARTPAASAVEAAGGTLTYDELDRRANRLARHLASLGVEVGVPVAISLPRSPDLIVALLATLKAGGICMPLDPAYPEERLRAMLEDSGATVLIGETSLHEHGLPVVRLDDEGVLPAADAPLDRGVAPADAAYLVYTSGSTGRPRGVLLPHRGLVNHALASVELYGLSPTDRVLQFSSISFDISIEEIFPTLAAGGTVVLRDDDLAPGGAAFVEWLRAARVTVLDLPTAFWHAWVNDLEQLGVEVPDEVRLVIVGGEKASRAAFDRWLDVGGRGRRWVNTYGPTEASVVASFFEPSGALEPGVEVPIGKPLRGTKLYVLDRHLEPVPIGVPGELFIGGVGVAEGYLREPELTRERFLPDPRGTQMYKTGDIVRWRTDGNLEFIGRRDHQVKIRGFRVEPAEVQAALESHPDVRLAYVTTRADHHSALQLVAYAQPADPGAPPASASLREYLGDKLPAYMLPSLFVIVDSIPLTPNGKVDEKALPEPTAASSEAHDVVAPRDEVERTLEGFWRELLEVERPIAIGEDFFALGGHSLLTVRLFAQIEEAFGVRLPLALVFRGATIEVLADAIRSETSAGGDSPLVLLRDGNGTTPLFLLHEEGDVGVYRELVRELPPRQTVYGVETGDAAECARELLRVWREGPILLAADLRSDAFAYAVCEELERSGRDVALVAVIDMDGGSRGPLGGRARGLVRRALAGGRRELTPAPAMPTTVAVVRPAAEDSGDVRALVTSLVRSIDVALGATDDRDALVADSRA